VIKERPENILKYIKIFEQKYSASGIRKSGANETGATGTISKSIRKYLRHIPGKQDVKVLQKAATMGTMHLLHKTIMYKHKKFFTGNSITFITHSNNKRAAILYTVYILEKLLQVRNCIYPA
jgi:hypothetical protein